MTDLRDGITSLHGIHANHNHGSMSHPIFKAMLRVVNDTAERGVKLFEEHNRLITNDEEEKQLLLQVVEAKRKQIPTHVTKQGLAVAVME